MKQLKLAVFVVFATALFFSCKKTRNNTSNNTPKKTCYGSFVTAKPLSWDSIALFKVDENGAASMYTKFQILTKYGLNEISMCYNKNDSCVYYLAGNDVTKDIYLYKCNLATKQTEKFTCTNPKEIDYMPDLWYLYHNSFTNEFYIGYSYWDTRWYTPVRRKLTIVGNTFSVNIFSVPGLYSPHNVAPYFIDEKTGDMYFNNDISIGYIRYSPVSGDTTMLSATTVVYEAKYNPNDGKVYGCNYAKQLVRLDLKTGATEAYGSLNASADSITGATFDVCNNQYVYYINSGVIDIYWVDVTLGTIVKHITTQDNYYSLIHIPQTQ